MGGEDCGAKSDFGKKQFFEKSRPPFWDPCPFPARIQQPYVNRTCHVDCEQQYNMMNPKNTIGIHMVLNMHTDHYASSNEIYL